MAKHVVVVESPAKANTIKKYLGRDYTVLASYGHVRDLLPKEGAVDTEHEFAMRYELIEKSQKHVDAIAKALRQADDMYLATDPDREGEAISWHLAEILKTRKGLKDKPVARVVFHEITRQAVQDAVAHPRDLSMELVNAQQARRALDYLVGFNLSPLLWKKIRRGLSAGRVQSPALRLIAEREEEIEAFQAREYWTVDAELDADGSPFSARLNRYQGEKVGQFSVENAEQAAAMHDWLTKAAKGRLTVEEVERKQRKRNPAAPFTTSTLQQEAVRKLGFSAQRTMRVAQQLYEGIDIGDGSTGLITYMRTDSVTLANEALDEIRSYVGERYGADKIPSKPRIYKTKAKNAQEAHEAIRPTSVQRDPDSLKAFLNRDQARLYELIWKRTVACQMIPATIALVGADLVCGDGNNFRATGSTVVDPGFMQVYREGVDDAKQEDDERMLPTLEKGQQVKLLQIRTDQHFTEPPPRYSEATLVKTLEEYGIGRPSTYATIISTLTNRGYVEMDKRRFRPTDVGRVVNRFLTQHFNKYVDYGFTASLEDDLDAVSRGEKQWVPLMKDFWGEFKQQVDDKAESVSRKDVTQEPLNEKCPKCGKQLSIRLGRRGRFIGCDGFPDCDYTRNLDSVDGEKEAPELVEGRKCPECGSDLLVRTGKYGKFIGCSAYPGCKYIEPLEKPEDTGVQCPACQQGNLLKRKSRRGKIFYSCARYPQCDYAVWNQPLAEPCPSCGWPILTLKVTKRQGTQKVCPRKECGWSEQVEDADQELEAG